LLSIISGLLVRVAMELAVFLLGDMAAGGETAVGSLAEFLVSQEENALVSFLVGGGGAVEEIGGGIWALVGGVSLVGGGDHGMVGKALVMLVREIVLEAASFSKYGGFSVGGPELVSCYVGSLIVLWTLPFRVAPRSSSRLTLSSEAADVAERRWAEFFSASRS